MPRLRLAVVQPFHAEALLRSGSVARAETKILAARALLEESKTGEEKLRARGLGWASLLAGEVLQQRGLGSRAQAEFESAWTALARADSLEQLTRVLRLRVALRLDRREDAESLARDLVDHGFREPRLLQIIREAFPGMARGAGDR